MPSNALAFEVMGELFELDRTRYLLTAAPQFDRTNINRVIEDGAFVYDSLLAYLHGEASGFARGTRRWLKFAQKSRRKMGENRDDADGTRPPGAPRGGDLVLEP